MWHRENSTYGQNLSFSHRLMKLVMRWPEQPGKPIYFWAILIVSFRKNSWICYLHFLQFIVHKFTKLIFLNHCFHVVIPLLKKCLGDLSSYWHGRELLCLSFKPLYTIGCTFRVNTCFLCSLVWGFQICPSFLFSAHLIWPAHFLLGVFSYVFFCPHSTNLLLPYFLR